MRARFVLVALIAATSLPRVASAEPTPADRAVAEALFRDARQLADAQTWPAACAKFAESQRIDPKLGTLLFLATCHEKEGKLASAWAEFNEARALSARVNQPEREKVARERAAAIEPRLTRLVVTAPEAEPTLEVKLDGRVLQAAVLGSGLPLDPGEHVVVATAPDSEPFTQTVVVAAEGETLKVVIPRLQPKAAAAVAPAPAPPPSADRSVEEGSSTRTLGFVIAGAGVLALAGGTFFGLRALSTKDDADKECEGRLCTQSGLDKQDEAQLLSHFSTAGFALGAIGVGLGTYFVLTAKPRSRGVAWTLSPMASPSGGGFAARARF